MLTGGWLATPVLDVGPTLAGAAGLHADAMITALPSSAVSLSGRLDKRVMR